MTSSDREAITVPAVPGEGSLATDLSCLVLHGLGGGPYELQPLIAALEAAGVRVLAPIMPGHEGPGRSCPARPGATGWRRLKGRSTCWRAAAGKLPSLAFDRRHARALPGKP